jgi:hypothetical protein
VTPSPMGLPAPSRAVMEACAKVADLLPGYITLRTFQSAFGTVRTAIDLDEAAALALAMKLPSTLQAVRSALLLSRTGTRGCMRAIQAAGTFG